ncbi:hypothetical protein [Nocardioides gilvus]|uniref:hypothetical protein n=1 Tax=Nocardioides gilvus TaxID=1735589 RepID=UPI000D74A3B2|nr:hypothetical protein [Nocardioides gilvus]
MSTPPARPRSLTTQAVDLAVKLMDQVGASGVLPAAEVKIGTPLESVDGRLFPFGTSGLAPDVAYLLVHSLPLTCGARRAPEGEPGAGAWEILLDKPIEDYIASGALREFTVSDD